MSPSGFADKLIHIITNSGPIGFALFFMSAVVFGLRYFTPQAVAFIDPSAMGYILCAGLFGAGLVIVKVAAWLIEKASKGSESFKDWRRRRTAPYRLHELLPLENSGLMWILVNKHDHVHGDRLHDPLDGLVRKGFLFLTDGREREQVLRVNPHVFKHSARLLRDCPPNVQDVWRGRRSPWDQTRERF
jgi:hypothetical protein